MAWSGQNQRKWSIYSLGNIIFRDDIILITLKRLKLYIFLLIFFILSGCFFSSDDSIKNGPDISNIEISISLINNTSTYFGANGYRTINKDWLINNYYSEWKNELAKKGIRNWSGKFQCNSFALSFISDLNKKYFIDSWHSKNITESLALGVIWYYINGETTNPEKYHALICFFDENKDLWGFEIQNGTVFKFSQAEINSMTLELFP